MFKKKTFAVITSTLVFMLGSLQVAAQNNKAENGVDDTIITTKVKAKLLADPVVSSLNISVETKKGVVSLTGDLPSEKEISAAVQDAHSIEGVTDVNGSGLKVQAGNHPMADTIITAKVKGLFIREKLFGEKEVPIMSIHVETKEGVVHLSGETESAVQAENAKKLTQSVQGVKEVKSSITVKK